MCFCCLASLLTFLCLQLNNVAASAFIANVDNFFGKDHLFLRSVLIIKAWCRFDSVAFVQEPILASQKSKLSSYCVSILVLHLFNVFDISHPLDAFTRFFRVYAHFDWKRFVCHSACLKYILSGVFCVISCMSSSMHSIVHLAWWRRSMAQFPSLKCIIALCGHHHTTKPGFRQSLSRSTLSSTALNQTKSKNFKFGISTSWTRSMNSITSVGRDSTRMGAPMPGPDRCAFTYRRSERESGRYI